VSFPTATSPCATRTASSPGRTRHDIEANAAAVRPARKAEASPEWSSTSKTRPGGASCRFRWPQRKAAVSRRALGRGRSRSGRAGARACRQRPACPRDIQGSPQRASGSADHLAPRQKGRGRHRGLIPYGPELAVLRCKARRAASSNADGADISPIFGGVICIKIVPARGCHLHDRAALISSERSVGPSQPGPGTGHTAGRWPRSKADAE
jgi:hypothetical protein